MHTTVLRPSTFFPSSLTLALKGSCCVSMRRLEPLCQRLETNHALYVGDQELLGYSPQLIIDGHSYRTCILTAALSARDHCAEAGRFLAPLVVSEAFDLEIVLCSEVATQSLAQLLSEWV